MSRIFPIPPKYIKRIEQIMFLIGIVLTGVGITWTLVYNYTFFSCNERHFQIRTPKEFKVWDEEIEIDCVLFKPKKESFMEITALYNANSNISYFHHLCLDNT